MNIYAWGIYIKEKEIENKIIDIIQEVKPDIVVITGHDYYNNQGIKDLSNYKNTSHFIDALRIIRKHFFLFDILYLLKQYKYFSSYLPLTKSMVRGNVSSLPSFPFQTALFYCST